MYFLTAVFINMNLDGPLGNYERRDACFSPSQEDKRRNYDVDER